MSLSALLKPAGPGTASFPWSSGGWRAAASCAYWKKGSKWNHFGMLLEYVFLISDTIKFLVYLNVYVALYKRRSCHAKRRCLDRFVTLGNANKEDYRPLKEWLNPFKLLHTFLLQLLFCFVFFFCKGITFGWCWLLWELLLNSNPQKKTILSSGTII